MTQNLSSNEVDAICSALNLLSNKDQRNIELNHNVDCGTLYDKLRGIETDAIRNYWTTTSSS
jgi:hypothetical protein